MTAARICRWTAIILAGLAIVDPPVPIPRPERPPVRIVTGSDEAERRSLVDRLRRDGFPIASDGESAVIVTPGAQMTPSLPSPPIYVVRAHTPDIAIVHVSGSGMRVEGQAIVATATLRARGARGTETTIRLEDGGLTVATATHRWGADEETWRAALTYLPHGPGAMRLRVRAGADSVADLFVPAARGPLRTLVLESGVTWPAVFVRRSLEDARGFSVAALQRTTKTIVTRTGTPPQRMTRSDLAPYEVVVIGQPESLDAATRDALRWFVEERGGVAVLAPDRMTAADAELAGGVGFDTRTLESPVTLAGLGAGLMASELAVPRVLPPLAFALAADSAGAPIVFGVRRGMGAVIVSGALDAWRYRDRNGAAFARFWPAAILQQAAAVPPPVEVTATPALVRPGDVVHLSARLRRTELRVEADRLVVPPVVARAVHPETSREGVIRLWPGPEPGTYEGEWRPDTAGDYVVDVGIGAVNGAAIVTVAPGAAAPPRDPDVRTIAARASGGAVVDGDEALMQALRDRFVARTVTHPVHPARSIWYAAAFTLLLCFEWAVRRRGGLS